MRKPRLMTPGPAMVPEDVLLELARPVIHHRSAEAKEVITEVAAGLKEVFQTQNDVLILTASGTGAMEAAAVNTVPPGGKALVLNAGVLRGAVGQHLQGVRHQRRLARYRVGPAGRPRPRRRGPAAAPRHGLRHGHPERDLDRDRPPGRGDRPGRRRDARRVRRRRDLGRRRHGVPHRRLGHRPALRRLAEGPDAPARPGVRRGQPQGLGQDRRLRLAQLLLQPQGRPQEDEGVRHAVHAGPHPDPGPAHGPAADQGGGDRERLAAASPDERGLPGRRPGARAWSSSAPGRPRA